MEVLRRRFSTQPFLIQCRITTQDLFPAGAISLVIYFLQEGYRAKTRPDGFRNQFQGNIK